MTVKVGDKVRYTGLDRGCLIPENIYTVVDTDHADYNMPIKVIDEDGDRIWLRRGQFEPIETGTLQELNVKPGDVVECVDEGVVPNTFTTGRHYVIQNGPSIILDRGNKWGKSTDCVHVFGNTSKFRIISRASDDTPKKWGDMSDEEKGALLLAHHRGEVIEEMELSKTRYIDVSGRWMDWTGPFNPKPHIAYRIKPEPVREARLVQICNLHGELIGYGDIDYINGTPDPDTIKMERI